MHHWSLIEVVYNRPKFIILIRSILAGPHLQKEGPFVSVIIYPKCTYYSYKYTTFTAYTCSFVFNLTAIKSNIYVFKSICCCCYIAKPQRGSLKTNWANIRILDLSTSTSNHHCVECMQAQAHMLSIAIFS